MAIFPSRVLLILIFISGLSIANGSLPASRRSTNTLRFSTKIGERGIHKVVRNHRVRAALDGNYGMLSSTITNTVIFYTAEVEVGSPGRNYTLVVDTGSSNTIVGTKASHPYIPTSTSQNTGNTISASFDNGKESYSGEEWLDTVTLGPGLVINQQSIGVATETTGFSGFDIDGILGLGPVRLTSHTVSNTKVVPTVMDNLKSQGTICEEVLGVFFVPASESKCGELTFGGYDVNSITSKMDYIPVTKTLPSSAFWGIDQSIFYDGTPILSTTAGFVDTGSIFISIASDAFKRYQSAIGATIDSATGLLTITSEQYEKLKPLTFYIGNKSYVLTPNAQIWPRALNAHIGGTSGSIYLVIADLGWSSDSGPGVNFINGYTFLERFYSVYDTTNSRVGFATTRYTNSTSN